MKGLQQLRGNCQESSRLRSRIRKGPVVLHCCPLEKLGYRTLGGSKRIPPQLLSQALGIQARLVGSGPCETAGS